MSPARAKTRHNGARIAGAPGEPDHGRGRPGWVTTKPSRAMSHCNSAKLLAATVPDGRRSRRAHRANDNKTVLVTTACTPARWPDCGEFSVNVRRDCSGCSRARYCYRRFWARPSAAQSIIAGVVACWRCPIWCGRPGLRGAPAQRVPSCSLPDLLVLGHCHLARIVTKTGSGASGLSDRMSGMASLI